MDLDRGQFRDPEVWTSFLRRYSLSKAFELCQKFGAYQGGREIPSFIPQNNAQNVILESFGAQSFQKIGGIIVC